MASAALPATAAGGFSALTWGLLVLTPTIIAGGQVLFKQAGVRGAGAPFVQTLFDPVFILAVGIYGLATLMWVWVLKTVPLSSAYSFMALSYVLVPILAVVFLGESLSWKYAAGTALILGGLFVVQS